MMQFTREKKKENPHPALAPRRSPRRRLRLPSRRLRRRAQQSPPPPAPIPVHPASKQGRRHRDRPLGLASTAFWGEGKRNRWIDASIRAATGGHPSRALQCDDDRGAVPRPRGRRHAARAAALHGWGGGSVRWGEWRPQPGAPGRRLRPPSGRVRPRPRRARHACRLTLPRPHRRPLPWSRVCEAVAQVCGTSVRGR